MTFPRLLRQVLLLLGLWSVLCSPGIAEPAYIPASRPALLKLIAPPPDALSEQQRHDVTAVLDAQRSRTDAQASRAKITGDSSVFAFADILGADFDAVKLPETRALFSRVKDEALASMQDVKDHWNRPRPYQVAAEIKPLERPSSSSYPSGTALLGHLYAIILADFLPARAGALFARGEEAGRDRVVAGVHFPTDIDAGRRAAVAVATVLFDSPAFRADAARVKEELGRVLR